MYWLIKYVYTNSFLPFQFPYPSIFATCYPFPEIFTSFPFLPNRANSPFYPSYPATFHIFSVFKLSQLLNQLSHHTEIRTWSVFYGTKQQNLKSVGTCKVRNEIETKRNETKPNEIKQNGTKPKETKRNVTSFRFVSFDFVSFRFVSISFRTLQVPIDNAR
jgi:hypothetical protein